MPLTAHRQALDALYVRYTRPEFIPPDPVGFLHGYSDLPDREIVGLVASCLAYGRAAQISKSVAVVLDRMPSPASFLADATPGTLVCTFAGFRHRFTTGDDVAAMLWGAKQAIREYGSLQACFLDGLNQDHQTIIPALSSFVDRLNRVSAGRRNYLLPSPRLGSACKRLNLFLRWMVRRDAVDLGGWDDVPASKLVIPLDTHMHRIGQALRLTTHKQAHLRAALDLTEAFRAIAPDDPVRYDFALTRLGIRGDADMGSFLDACGISPG